MSIREIESESILTYVRAAARRGCFAGRVLDYGAGKQPYRKIVEGVDGVYTPFDRMEFPGSVVTTDIGDDEPLFGEKWDAILCTQVLQYVPNSVQIEEMDEKSPVDGPTDLLMQMYEALKPGGHLVITGPTNWPVVEFADLHRFTVEGIVHRLGLAGFPVVDCHYRAQVMFEGERWPLGWGAIATKEDS